MHRNDTLNGTPPLTCPPATAQCDNRSVGVIIQRDDGQYLMFDRATFPAGVAGAAGHIDDHGDGADAARAEVAEELGLTATSLTLELTAWRSNRCRRLPGQAGVGHQWELYRAEVSGTLNPSVRETRNVRWLRDVELQELADQTAAYAAGLMTDEEFAKDPGIEPVWVAWLQAAGIISMSAEELSLIDEVAANGSLSVPPTQKADPEREGALAPVPTTPQLRARLERLDDSGAADLIAETAAARTELMRTDTKANTVLAFAGGAFSVLAALSVLASGLALPTRVGLWVAVALLASASAVALTVIRPTLPRHGDGTGFTAHAAVGDVEELLDQLAADPESRRARDVIRLSQIACAKYRVLRTAVDLMLAALGVVVISIPFGLL
ncbi:NUDIX domain-containing protein [Streptosporangium subroseum]|uniref:NUDIX domain-containing protein n=1 Tax=Streptosporangium subroseum TaxID=106412 RepID=A0A239P0X3_9ACTN|nr:Pycsar system effector family protein [Streptosporangium subroseum]SNT60642.1 NUDIX domain-containing protein [Streptosporangium subroseum]